MKTILIKSTTAQMKTMINKSHTVYAICSRTKMRNEPLTDGPKPMHTHTNGLQMGSAALCASKAELTCCYVCTKCMNVCRFFIMVVYVDKNA